jgi:hypothetical protein
MFWFLLPILFAFSLYKSFTALKTKTLFVALCSVLVAGLIVERTDSHMTTLTDCGKFYYIDTGCSMALPDWWVPLGFGLLLVAIVLSVVILYIPKNNAKAR